MKSPNEGLPTAGNNEGAIATALQAGRRTNAAVIYEVLFKSIARNELRPGDLLQEKALTERFGVSRTPLRTPESTRARASKET